MSELYEVIELVWVCSVCRDEYFERQRVLFGTGGSYDKRPTHRSHPLNPPGWSYISWMGSQLQKYPGLCCPTCVCLANAYYESGDGVALKALDDRWKEGHGL
jgi:hypothetical protein